jgi:hypothetical protein
MAYRDQPPSNQQMSPYDYGMALITVAFPLLSLGIQLFNWWPQTGTAGVSTTASAIPQAATEILFRKQVAFSVTAVIALLIQIMAVRYERSRHGDQWRRNAVSDILNRTLQELDRGHTLNARLNVMVVHPRYRPPFWDFRIPLPWWWSIIPRPRLYIFACSDNLRDTAEARLPWTKNNGCAGALWASEDHFAFADLSNKTDDGKFRMSDRQRQLTKDRSCIITLAIFDGAGPATRLRGFISLDSDNPTAPESWLSSEDKLKRIRQVLRGVGIYLAREDLLP